MILSPYGYISETLKNGLREKVHIHNDPMHKCRAFRKTRADYEAILVEWCSEMRKHVWPEYEKEDKWIGGAEVFAEAATRSELQICIEEFQNRGILAETPMIGQSHPRAQHRSHLFHFRLEDAARKPTPDPREFDSQVTKGPGANFIGYYPEVDAANFNREFWFENRDREPSFLAIKLLFQRPRPWTAARVFGMEEFEWHTGTPIAHTGVHPAFPSGHCYQGLVHCAHVLQNWRRRARAQGSKVSDDAIAALKQYAVDRGDRRVYAGVHYPTDNIASWLLALRLVEHMFDDGVDAKNFVADAVLNYSNVYKVIQNRFPNFEELRPSLDLLNHHLPRQLEAEVKGDTS